MTQDQRREQTKKALLDALVICLKDQDFNEITTIRLVQTAGISRSSFYTHYKDKYEMIDSYQKELFHKLEYIFDKYEGKKEGAFLEIFDFLTREKLLSALLSTNGSKEIQDFLIQPQLPCWLFLMPQPYLPPAQAVPLPVLPTGQKPDHWNKAPAHILRHPSHPLLPYPYPHPQ